jgi:hypothetical protein
VGQYNTVKYINIKTDKVIETIDEINLSEFGSVSEFWKECRRLISEYRLAYHGMGIEVYLSQKATKEWKQ